MYTINQTYNCMVPKSLMKFRLCVRILCIFCIASNMQTQCNQFRASFQFGFFFFRLICERVFVFCVCTICYAIVNANVCFCIAIITTCFAQLPHMTYIIIQIGWNCAKISESSNVSEWHCISLVVCVHVWAGNLALPLYI